MLHFFEQQMAYCVDSWQRSILFLDVLRERANNLLDREQEGLPLLLNFNYEVLLDARTFKSPVNYALLKITAVGECCLEECLDEKKATHSHH